MNSEAIAEELAIAEEHFRAGRLGEAEAGCRKVLGSDANQVDALHMLGCIAQRTGKHELAERLVGRAIAVKPRAEQLHCSLGSIFHSQRRYDRAIAAFGAALRLNPSYASAHGSVGNVLADSGRLDEAVASYRAAIALSPDDAAVCNNLGSVLAEQRKWEEAKRAFHGAIAANPHFAEARYNLANVLVREGQADAAIAEYRAALRLKPDYPDAISNLGSVLMWQGHSALAIAEYRRAIAVQPDYLQAHNNLGNALKDQGELEAAMESYRRAMVLRPDNAIAHSNLVFSLQFSPDCEAGAVHREQTSWNRLHAWPLRAFRAPHRNSRDLARRLKVGFVSPDFCNHPISYFVIPYFETHDSASLEVYCYSSVWRSDDVTERFRKCANAWRDVSAVSDAALAELIRADGVDILVDLTMHSAGNRLPAFARKPAPVQVSWLAYPAGSGLETMDYRLTDAQMDPQADEGGSFCERPIRLPDAWCCYSPIGDFPEVAKAPALEAGHVTFGSLNNFCKVNTSVLECWARLLAGTPASRLLMLCPEGDCRSRVIGMFDAHAVAADRIEFVTFRAWEDYVRLYQHIDISLDSFPCNGMTTTCHALWMGVPVITLNGATPFSRAGLSILTTIGMREWVGDNKERYVRIAGELASDIPRLVETRATLRERMRSSPLMDAPRFARNVEDAFRTMWRKWCE